MSVQAAPRQGPVTVDGRLDEPAWQGAEVATGFTQVEPEEGMPAREATEVRILFDAENLYVGARMWDSDPTTIARQLTRRGEGGRAYDYFQLSLDSNLDRRTGYTFRVTAAGVQVDRFHPDDSGSESAWEAVWESAVRIDDQGWTAELRIPLSQLRFEAAPGPQSWGVNFARRKISTNERSDWAWTPAGVPGTVSRYGELRGLVLPVRRRHLEVAPYVMAGLERRPVVPGDPFFDGQAGTGRIGADLRYGLGSTFILDVAVNPDFGQVEVDPRVINLTAFETFFPEQRPFFSRDDRAFDYNLSGGQNSLFYPRRVGRSPQGRPPVGADHVDLPTETTILGAAKVTGRTGGGLTVGFLGALTAREEGRTFFREGERVEPFVAEPRTRYGIVRVQQDLRDSESRVGGMLTGTFRELPLDGSLDLLPGSALSGGLDFEHTWADREWALWGFLAGSHVRGSEAALLRIQRAPNHYHQRPDQDYLTLDPHRTTLSGAEWRLQMEKRGGRHWTGAVWAAQRTPGFEVNDLGFSTATERLDGGARLSYREVTPGELFRSYNVSIFTFHNWRHSVLDDPLSASAWGEAHKAGQVTANAGFTFLNWRELQLSGTYRPRVLSDALTRGGPLMVRPGARTVRVGGNTDRRNQVGWQASLEYEDGGPGGSAFTTSLGVEARPVNGLLLALDPTYRRSLIRDQYVLTHPDPGFTPTYGARYLFGDLEREEFSVDTRVNLIFSPSVTLQLFVQPLISSGEYREYKQLARPGSFDFIHFQEGDPVALPGGMGCSGGPLCRDGDRILLDYTGDGSSDLTFAERSFSVRSLRGNAVFRWEYRPGSRLFLVWQQRRQGSGLPGTFDFGGDLRGLLDAPPENVFMVKLSYWLSL